MMTASHVIFILVLFHHITQGLFQKGPPVVTAPIQPRFTGKLGEGIRFICPIRADPEPIFEWYRDGERVMEYWDRYRFMSKGYSLNIQRLECEDQGTYVCKAINGFGVHEISFQLDLLDGTLQEACKTSSDEDDVSSKPVILHKPKKPKHLLKPAGNYALLKCTAVAEPLPTFHWFKDDVEISADKSKSTSSMPKYVLRSTVLSEEDLDGDMEGLRSTLQISDLRGTDTGNYTCRAQNEHGWDELIQKLEVVEKQIPRRPELHPDFPPVHTWVEMGEVSSLSCKVLSEFPPEIHWLKRITPLNGPAVTVPSFPEEDDYPTQPQFIANRTLTIGNTQFRILPPAPVKQASDSYYVSILLLSKKSQESDAGYYVCLALNNAGYNYRQVYLNITNFGSNQHGEGDGAITSTEGWGEKGRADATTTAVVVVVVVCGLIGMVTSCYVLKRRKNNLKGKALAVTSPPEAPIPGSILIETTTTAPLQNTTDYSLFREGLLAKGSILASTSSARSDPIGHAIQHSPISFQKEEEQPQHRVYYLPPRISNKSVPSKSNGRQQTQQQKMIQRMKIANTSNGSGARTNGVPRQHHRSSPRSSNSSNGHHHFYDPPYHYQLTPPESRPLTANTSFHSDSFYPDWSAHPQHIRLPYPSPETSFDQM